VRSNAIVHQIRIELYPVYAGKSDVRNAVCDGSQGENAICVASLDVGWYIWRTAGGDQKAIIWDRLTRVGANGLAGRFKFFHPCMKAKINSGCLAGPLKIIFSGVSLAGVIMAVALSMFPFVMPPSLSQMSA
jgi:hypothetical protein